MRTYPSKLLLFGEYAIINGGNGLALPLFLFEGSWSHYNIYSVEAEFSRKHLKALYDYIAEHDALSRICNLKAYKEDLAAGVWLSANIPYGYGLGSSGALSAAVYDRYFEKGEDLSQIKNHLALIEGHFHGSSSGLDPIVSFSKCCIVIEEKIPKPIAHYPSPSFKINLLDTGISRNSTPLIATYLEKSKNEAFKNALLTYRALNDKCIGDFLQGDAASLKDNLYKLSEWQFEYFDFLIPSDIKKHWEEALKQSNYIFKICGAGGGGYILVFEFEAESIPSNLHTIYNIMQAI